MELEGTTSLQQMTLCQSTATLALGTFFSRHIGGSLSSRGAFLFVAGVVAVFVLALFSRVGWACLSTHFPFYKRWQFPFCLPGAWLQGCWSFLFLRRCPSQQSPPRRTQLQQALCFFGHWGQGPGPLAFGPLPACSLKGPCQEPHLLAPCLELAALLFLPFYQGG